MEPRGPSIPRSLRFTENDCTSNDLPGARGDTMSATTTAVPTGTYTVDPTHSRVECAVKHLGIPTGRGTSGPFEGSVGVGEALAHGTAAGVVEVAPRATKELP